MPLLEIRHRNDDAVGRHRHRHRHLRRRLCDTVILLDEHVPAGGHDHHNAFSLHRFEEFDGVIVNCDVRDTKVSRQQLHMGERIAFTQGQNAGDWRKFGDGLRNHCNVCSVEHSAFKRLERIEYPQCASSDAAVQRYCSTDWLARNFNDASGQVIDILRQGLDRVTEHPHRRAAQEVVAKTGGAGIQCGVANKRLGKGVTNRAERPTGSSFQPGHSGAVGVQ